MKSINQSGFLVKKKGIYKKNIAISDFGDYYNFFDYSVLVEEAAIDLACSLGFIGKIRQERHAVLKRQIQDFCDDSWRPKAAWKSVITLQSLGTNEVLRLGFEYVSNRGKLKPLRR